LHEKDALDLFTGIKKEDIHQSPDDAHNGRQQKIDDLFRGNQFLAPFNGALPVASKENTRADNDRVLPPRFHTGNLTQNRRFTKAIYIELEKLHRRSDAVRGEWLQPSLI
jgi:hypothetical protein